ncbi:MAG: cyclase family protein [Acidobacteriales bacterium]|nr:cyclase family protein [Terriglobales bacterium]
MKLGDLISTRALVAGCVLAVAIFVFGQRRVSVEPVAEFRDVIDLTHPVSSQHTSQFAALKTAPLATRIEAPANYASSLWTVGQIPPARLVAPLVVLDVRTGVKSNPDYQVSMADLIQWEKENGPIPMGAIVMARSGWESKWKSAQTYGNADKRGAMHFPSYSPDAAKFLTEGRNVIGLGIDTLSVAPAASKNSAVYQYTLSHSVYQLDNVANLDRAPARGAIAMIAPDKLENGLSAPVRILALVR